jgi:hypothetical protein
MDQYQNQINSRFNLKQLQLLLAVSLPFLVHHLALPPLVVLVVLVVLVMQPVARQVAQRVV